MSAVNPSRLQIQLEELLKYFYQPEVFKRRLDNLFSLYANRALNLPQSSGTTSNFPKYHLPKPLIRQLQMAVKPYIEKDPHAALACADELWQDFHFEIKSFAVFVLGNVPVEKPDPIIRRLSNWIDPDLDDELKSTLLSTGTSQLMEMFPSAWVDFIQSLLVQKDQNLVGLGLHGLITGIKKEKFANFPMIFRLISPIIQNPHTSYLETLENLLKVLIEKSPTETAFFLKQTLPLSQSKETKRIIKRMLPMLPEKDRQELKASLS